MKPMNYTEARANLASVLDSATEDLEEVVVTRAGHEPAVVVALSHYEALKETAYLLGNPANARHLERSIAEHRGGEAMPRELADIDEDKGTDLADVDLADVDPRVFVEGMERVREAVESAVKAQGKTIGPKAPK